MMSYWVAFARGGRPGRGVDGDQPAWHPWETQEGDPRFMVFDGEADGGIRMLSGALEVAGIIESVQADESFESPAERCDLLARMAQAGALFGPEDLLATGCPGVD